jgi:hypothetical protein
MICRTSVIGVGCPMAIVIPLLIQLAASSSSIMRSRLSVFMLSSGSLTLLRIDGIGKLNGIISNALAGGPVVPNFCTLRAAERRKLTLWR